jgi:hypothetical protein
MLGLLSLADIDCSSLVRGSDKGQGEGQKAVEEAGNEADSCRLGR